jgi:putative ABC transport system ATP-binding protein
VVALRAEGLVKRHGAHAVLDGVDLTLEPGDAVLVRGRSGSGKSTLLHLLAGIEVPDAGRVSLAGQDLAALDEAGRARLRLAHVGLVFQHFNLLPDLTAEENVRLPLLLARRDGPAGRARAAQLLAQVGLADQARRFPATMSGGELQRVAIARALANDPAVLLADEPTANLDEANARVVLDLLRGLAGEGRAVLLASHDALALEAFGRGLELRQGRLVPMGPDITR